MFGRVMRIAARIRALFTRDDLDRDLAEELREHLALEIEANLRRGLTPEEASRQARIRVGNPESLKEQHRAVRGLPLLDALLLDVGFAVRLIRRDRWFSAAAIAALALGIGANAAGFTLVNAVFLKGLPFDEADRLYVLTWQNRSGRRTNVSHADLLDWRARSTSFEGMAASRSGAMNVSDDRTLPELARGAWVTANTFDVVRQRPVVGRGFDPADERPGAEPVVVVNARFSIARYGEPATALGKSLRVIGTPATIVGVMPDTMKFPDNTSIWAPFIPDAGQLARDARVLAAIGRLAEGRDRRAAQAELSIIGERLVADHPDTSRQLTGVVRVETVTERSVGGGARPMFYTVMGAVVFVLLIACANVANLLLVRSGVRAREMAMRTAIGATRGRIVRQLLTESLVLSSIGAALALPLAAAGVRLFGTSMPPVMPYWIAFALDYRVVAYVAGVCVGTALLFGLVPALLVSNLAGSSVLKEGGRGTVGSLRLRRFSSVMVVAELALTIVLLAGAGLMMRSFLTLAAIDLGIDSQRLLTMGVQLPEPKYRAPDSRRAFFERLEPRIAAIPGVEGVAVTNGVPPHDGGERFLEVDTPAAQGIDPVMVGTVAITPGFFEVAGVQLLRGRPFDNADGAPGSESVIINERLAEQFFPGVDPIGRRLRFMQRGATPGRSSDVWRTIVAISPSIGHGSAEDRYANAVVYIPYRAETPRAVSLLIRTGLPAASIVDALRREVQALDPDQPLAPMQTAAEVVAETQWWYRVWGGVFGAIALVAVLLSAVGLYGVVAYSVTQRTQEIGVRMAVGARPRDVCWLVLRRGLGQLAVGLPLGLAAALAMSRVIWAGGVGPIASTDPLTFAAITLLLAAVALAACIVPARRAARVDPMMALRAE